MNVDEQLQHVLPDLDRTYDIESTDRNRDHEFRDDPRAIRLMTFQRHQLVQVMAKHSHDRVRLWAALRREQRAEHEEYYGLGAHDVE